MDSFLGYNAQDNMFFPFAAISAFLMLLIFKQRKASFIVPSIILGLIIANPRFKDFWENYLHLYYYWRVLWIVPVIPISAALPCVLSEKTSNHFLKGFVVISFVILFIVSGSSVYYKYDNYGNKINNFDFPAQNFEKLPQDVLDVANSLLEMDDAPRIIADPAIAVYIRQYTSKIDTIFGRNIYGYIAKPSETALSVYQQLQAEDGDYSVVKSAMISGHYNYLVIKKPSSHQNEQLLSNHFTLVKIVSGWYIYTTIA